jgi:hypothetical protein
MLSPGRHQFHRTAGGGRVAIVLADAIEKGFRPLLDASAVLNAAMTESRGGDSD